MTMWHNVSALAKGNAKTRMMDRAEVERVIRASAEDIISRLKQNQEPLYGDVRVRLMLERVDG